MNLCATTSISAAEEDDAGERAEQRPQQAPVVRVEEREGDRAGEQRDRCGGAAEAAPFRRERDRVLVHAALLHGRKRFPGHVGSVRRGADRLSPTCGGTRGLLRLRPAVPPPRRRGRRRARRRVRQGDAVGVEAEARVAAHRADADGERVAGGQRHGGVDGAQAAAGEVDGEARAREGSRRPGGTCAGWPR